MADIRDFESELTAICGFSPTQENAEELLIRGCYDVVNRFKMVNPEILSTFATSATLSDANGYNLVSNNVYMVLDVQKENPSDHDNLVRCIMVNPNERGKYEDVGSLFYALDSSPVAYVLNGLLYVLPAPIGDGEDVFLSLIKISDTVTNYASGVSSITGFPTSYNYFIILYAGYHLLLQEAVGYAGDSTISTAFTDIGTAVDALSTLASTIGTSMAAGDVVLDNISFTDFGTAIGKVDAIISTQTADWDSFITAEDSEMSNAALAGTSARIQEAQAQLGKIGAQLQQAQSYSAIGQGYLNQMQTYVAEISGHVNLIQGKLSSIANDVNLYREQAKAIREQYEALFVPYRSK